MFDLSAAFFIWLPILLAMWVSFVKSSLQAGLCLLILLGLSLSKLEPIYLWPFCVGTALLLFCALLIPKPNPRHRKRRFRLLRLFYALLLLYLGLQLAPQFKLLASATPIDSEFDLLLLAPLSFFVLSLTFLFTRKHVS
ncbi:MAG: hypothetical protein JKY15_01125 [Deltaproteobacteria bacterium]|nr:hypothetical protein [Deltaproteobacteria bacterium]